VEGRVSRYVGLLRGVNVGGKNKLPMAELRALFESLDHTNVSTFIQSGNIVFTTAKPIAAKDLERAIAKQFGIAPSVMLRTPQELRKIVKSNPFSGVDPSTLHVGFMEQKPSAAAVKQLDSERFLPDELAIRGREIYFHLPNGMGRTKLPPYVDRQLKIPTTVRNWNTVNKLIELGAES
jgi:uncharacterized protein (DUF1697 family)